MAVKSFYELASLISGSQFLAMQDGGTAPTAADFSPRTAWNARDGSAGLAAAGTASQADSQTVKARTTFATVGSSHPAAPDNTTGNAFRVPSPLYLRFPAGNWTLGLALSSTGANPSFLFDGRCQARWRVFSSRAGDGSGVVELTTSTVVSAATTAALTAGTTTINATWNAPQIILGDEYLYFALAIGITQAASTLAASTDINLKVGATAVITTTDAGLPEVVGRVFV